MGSRSHDDLIWVFLHWWNIQFQFYLQYFEKFSQSDFTAVNSGRAGGGILRRMLFIMSSIGDADCTNCLKCHQLKIQFCFSHYSSHRWHWSHYNASFSPFNASSLPFNMFPRCPLMPPPHCPLTPSYCPLTTPHWPLKLFLRSSTPLSCPITPSRRLIISPSACLII